MVLKGAYMYSNKIWKFEQVIPFISFALSSSIFSLRIVNYFTLDMDVNRLKCNGVILTSDGTLINHCSSVGNNKCSYIQINIHHSSLLHMWYDGTLSALHLSLITTEVTHFIGQLYNVHIPFLPYLARRISSPIWN